MKQIIYDYDGIILQDILKVPMYYINIPFIGCTTYYNNECYIVTDRVFDAKDKCLTIQLKKS